MNENGYGLGVLIRAAAKVLGDAFPEVPVYAGEKSVQDLQVPCFFIAPEPPEEEPLTHGRRQWSVTLRVQYFSGKAEDLDGFYRMAEGLMDALRTLPLTDGECPSRTLRYDIADSVLTVQGTYRVLVEREDTGETMEVMCLRQYAGQA